jgi:hypothetical protein
MRQKRSPVQSLSASPEALFSMDATIFLHKRQKTSALQSATSAPGSAASNNTMSMLDLREYSARPDSPYSDETDPEQDVTMEAPAAAIKDPNAVSDSKLSGLKAAKKFIQKAIDLVGRDTGRIPTHRELLHMGLTNAVQVRARKFLVSVGGIAVNVRTRLCDRYKTLGQLLDYLESIPDSS